MLTSSIISPGMRVAVMGLGVSGRSAVRFCLACGAEVVVSDLRGEVRFLQEEGDYLKSSGVRWEAGGHTLAFLSKADCVVLSPGVAVDDQLITALNGLGIRIAGELAVVAGGFDIPVVAVTGTNGKTTVTTLIGEVAKKWGKRVFVGGNIGIPLYELFLDSQKYDLVVAEISSFQLESAGDFAPDIGVLLNITPDHLDRHKSLEGYVEAKMRIFTNQKKAQFAVVNGDDHHCQNLDPDFAAQMRSFGAGKYNDLIVDKSLSRLTIVEDGEAVVLDSLGTVSGFTGLNYGAAVLALRGLGCPLRIIEAGIREFSPPSHRLEFVAENCGVKYYNDSKATNSGAVIGALEKMDCPVVLIAGGRDKGDDYGLLQNSVQDKVKLLILIGESAGLIEEALGECVETVRSGSLEEAVVLASASAAPGDAVLLSPACASFDMFRSYGHRGDEFKRLVLEKHKGVSWS